MNIIPMVLDKKENKDLAFDLYSLLLSNRIIFLNGEIKDDNASIVVGELLYLDSLNHNDIYLYINSPGGSVTAGLSIYDTMHYVKANVITIGIGMCASMGAFLLSSGNKRYALENTEIMIHEVLGGAQGQATDILIQTNHIIKIKEKVNKLLAKNTGKTLAKITKDTSRDNYMDAKEALDYGLIDKIISQPE